MSFLASSRAALSKSTSFTSELVSCLHTSASCSFRQSPRSCAETAPSRTRLVKNLASSGKLEVAPRFEREGAPHIGRPVRNRPAPIRRLGTREEDLKHRNHRSASAPHIARPVQKRPAPLNGFNTREEDSRHQNPKVDFLSLSSTVPQGVSETHAVRSRPKIINPLSDEFDISKRAVSTKELPKEFTSPPLMNGILASLQDVLGRDAHPTPIQALSLKHLMGGTPSATDGPPQYHEYLLASETGSGKSIAYLLPMLQDLKQTELTGSQRRQTLEGPRRAMNPRALVLAPTHELSRQLSGFAKELLHNVKLRVLCASRANVPSRQQATVAQVADALVEGQDGELKFTPEGLRSATQAHPIDLIVGTPSKVLELIRGRKWDHEEPEELSGTEKRSRRKATVGQPTMGLANVEWVVVDEADVLFDPDFQEATRMILADISAARGHPVPFDPMLNLSDKTSPTPLNYPFNLILTSATIPFSLAAYLDKFHPSLTRLASPHLHKLPSTLKTEHFSWSGGSRDADIEHRLRRVWYDDLQQGGQKSKVLIFCNKSARVENLGASLRGKGIANVALTSMGEARQRGSNHHLEGFLRVRDAGDHDAPTAPPVTSAPTMDDLKDVPHVMITTSLLSRGLDFAQDVRHVFIVDEPRNMVDFLHRAGRSGRAGEAGKVVVFGKTKGRGSEKAKVVRKKVGALVA